MSKRPDAIGFFWEDLPAVKPPKKEKPQKVIPERTWEHPDYLPNLYDALAYDQIPKFTDGELFMARGGELVMDIECFINYFFIGFRCPKTMKLVDFEMSPMNSFQMNLGKLEWILHNFTIVTFNGIHYDMPIVTLALAGMPVHTLKAATNQIIKEGVAPYLVLRSMKVKQLKQVDHVDLMEVCPLSGSLKKYAARLHAKRMQDLPFNPETILTQDQAAVVRWYCVESDIPATILIRQELSEQLDLRVQMSNEYGVDLRSKSDAQIAEAIISESVRKITGMRLSPPEIPPGTTFYYQVPAILRYQTPTLQYVLDVVRRTPFVVDESGYVPVPPEIKELKVPIAYSLYKMGRGGLHSSESKITHVTDGTFRLIDIDVESYYPRSIINQGMVPPALGAAFLQIFEGIVNRRLHAKHEAKRCKEAGDKEGERKWKIVADSLKITINGTFGKLGSPYSVMYAPQLLSQVTITGQLLLLMLIERLELACIHVISANTDGIVSRVPNNRYNEFKAIVKQWERDTGYITEEAEYERIMYRDVNSYMAFKANGEVKFKGEFSHHWKNPKDFIFRFHKNPVTLVCMEAIENYFTKKIPVTQYIKECKDITRFVCVRDVKGGGVKVDNEGRTQQYLGKMVRWYYAKEEPGQIVYAQSGNKVARSEGAKPLMQLPDTFPDDLDYDWYINEAEEMLRSVGYV